MRSLLAVLILVGGVACGEKDGGTETGTASSSGEASTGEACTPGETKMESDCTQCVCSDDGTWLCPGYRCDPTGGEVMTGTSTGEGSTTGGSTGGSTTGSTSSG